MSATFFQPSASYRPEYEDSPAASGSGRKEPSYAVTTDAQPHGSHYRWGVRWPGRVLRSRPSDRTPDLRARHANDRDRLYRLPGALAGDAEGWHERARHAAVHTGCRRVAAARE